MPRVGDKHFPYSKEGRKMAEEYAKRTGKKVEDAKKSSSSAASKKRK